MIYDIIIPQIVSYRHHRPPDPGGFLEDQTSIRDAATANTRSWWMMPGSSHGYKTIKLNDSCLIVVFHAEIQFKKTLELLELLPHKQNRVLF